MKFVKLLFIGLILSGCDSSPTRKDACFELADGSKRTGVIAAEKPSGLFYIVRMDDNQSLVKIKYNAYLIIPCEKEEEEYQYQ